MSRKQFIVLFVVLLVLAGAGAWVKLSDDADWNATDQRVGKPVLNGVTVADVAEVKLTGAAGSSTLKRAADGWVLAERADFPADVERIRDLLVKLVGLRASQAEPLTDALRARYGVAEPKAADTAGAATVLELRSKDGKALARLLLGQVINKKVEQQTQQGQTVTRDVPSGRYLVGAESNMVVTVNEPLTQADPTPASWMTKEIMRAERPRQMVSTLSGHGRWGFQRDTDSALWKWIAASDPLDQQKAQDVANVLYSVNLIDVADPAKVDLAKPVAVKLNTFDGFTYDVQLGAKTDKDQYPFKFSVTAEYPRQRTPGKNESAEDKAKEDKAFEERLKSLDQKLAMEKKYSGWTYLVSKTVAEPILNERAGFAPPKKEPAKK